MPLPITESEIEQILRDTPFARTYDIRLHSIRDGECTIEIPFQKNFERPDRKINGSVYMAAADVAMWFAIMTRLGKMVGAVTVEMKTSFIKSAEQENILCTAKILKLGKRLVFGEAECKNARGDLLAHHTLTYMRPEG